MKAILHTRYGDPATVLHLADVPKPTPKDDEVLVRVKAASVHPDIWHVVTGRPYALRLMGAGLKAPKDRIPGTDLAGVVEAVGPKVTRFQAGDEVFGESLRGMQWRNGGAFAEYVAAPEVSLALKPEGLSFAEAAAIPTAGYIVLSNMRNGESLKPGQSVLINGAGGGVGGIAVQVAKARGAVVTGVESAAKLDMVRGLGADRVLDYARDDVLGGGERYDLIFDVASTLRFTECRKALKPEGKYVLIGHDHFGKAKGPVFGSLTSFLRLALRTPFTRQLPRMDTSMPDRRESMEYLRALAEAGSLRPVIARTFPLEEAVAALRLLEAGTAVGRIVLTP